ncbi:MAG TPA: DNA primase [Thermoanaerobaculia bacterium]|jgi:DNA primase|nr:DNA primase [Thermoanaerobaculia bacterium]
MSDALDLNDRVLADIRAAADIVDVIGEHTTLKKAGNSWKGLCPFHREKTPSFTVNRDRGLFYCFGCGAGGDLFGFVRQMERVEFREAAEILARKYGIEIPKRTRRDGSDRSEKLREAVAKAHKTYVEALGKAPNRALAYLESRGVPEDAARELGLGFAPEGWDFLARSLSSFFTPDILIEAGLLQPGAEGKRPYDRQRDRLVFPIRDERGHVVGFGGRSLSGEEPKYLNSPETPIFAKNRLLYGLPAARDAIRREDRTILVEGYFDHLALWLSGCANTVASMGTAFGRPQAEKLRRLAPRAVLCYDGDAAGRNATRRAIPILLSEGIEVRVARMPAGLDPFDLFRESGGEAVRKAVEQAPAFLEWLLSDLESAPAEPEARGEVVNGILSILESVPDRVLRYEYVRRVSEEAGIPADVLWKRAPARPVPSEGTKPGSESFSRVPLPAVERRLLSLLVNGGEEAAAFLEIDPEYFSDPRLRAIFLAVGSEKKEGEALDFPRVATHLETGDERTLLSELACDEEPPGGIEAISQYVNYLARGYLERQAAVVQQAIVAAESRGDKEEIDRLFRSKTALRQQIADLGRDGARRKNC